MMSALEYHPLANEFPLMEGEQFAALVENIKRNGLLEPILLCDGKIIDGRNRYRACIEADAELRVEIMDNKDHAAWVAFVEAKNLTRRHLTESQRAMIAARMSQMRGLSTDQAATLLNVKTRTAQKASVVHRHGSENVIDLVKRGDLSVSRAHAVTVGTIAESEMLVDRRRAGRPIGDHHVNAMRNILTECERLFDYGDKIVNHWPGDPDMNRRLSFVVRFMTNLQARTREADHADAVA